MNLKKLQSILILFILLSFSCTSYKNIPYFQDLKPDGVVSEKITNFSPLLIQPGDLLGLHVTSLDHEADAAFNYNLVRPNGNLVGNTAVGGVSTSSVDQVEQNAVVGFLVDQDGNINLPSIGYVKVSGYSTKECSTILEQKLSELLSKPNVSVRIQNFKVSVLGDVKNPGSISINNERVTIPEALSLAGDLNTTGIRTNVLLIREINGTRQYVRLDLTSKNVFNSPYYYLRNNDVIYVQPNKERVNNDGTAFQKATLVLTVISILAIILSKNL